MSQLKVDSIIPRGGLPSGSSGGIVQVRSVIKTDPFTTTSSSFTDITGLSVSITPQSSSNKILIQVCVSGDGRQSQSRANFRLMRGSTAICIGDTAGGRARSTFAIYRPNDDHTTETASMTHLDSPATTSAVTYKMQIVSGNGGGNQVSVNRAYNWSDAFAHAATVSSITVMEVSG
tara:strand:- start:409 stop:936 length:528 start_codon:yes stop_codon:yes gene_type:complete